MKYRHFLVPVLEMVPALGLGILLVRGHEMGITKADFTALAAALFMCYDPLKRLGVTLTNLKSAHASLERINYLLKEPDTMPEAANPVPLGRASGRLDYDGVSFSYDGARKVLDGIDVLINVGDGDTAHTGGKVWEDPDISAAVKGFVHRGGGLIGVGEPGGHQYQGRYLQLSAPLGVEKETGFTLNYDKYNWDEHRDHFILADCPDHDVDFGEGKKSIFALEGTEILIQRDKEVQMAAHEYGQGRGVYISGLPYSFVNNRVLYRAILWAAHDEADLHKWFSTNYNVEVHAYVKNGKYCVVNNTYEPQDTTVYTGDGSSFTLHMDANEIKWYNL